MRHLDKFIIPGKVNMCIGGGFGSTGKGAISAAIAMDNDITVSCSTTSPNAGHTFYWDDRKYVTHLIPASAIINKRNQIYFSAESVIDEDLLLKEIDEFNIDPARIAIHPRAMVIRQEDKNQEHQPGGIEVIASTQSGTGAVRAAKILRQPVTVEQHPRLKEFARVLPLMRWMDDFDAGIYVETGQGLGLDINHGLAYPYCTSRSVHPGQILAELGVLPQYMGNLMLCTRTFPIRVGNPTRDGKEVGYSGPFYDDSTEIQFKDLGVEDELTTVTKRVRRVSTFSMEQYEYEIDFLRPTHVFLNFINYYENGKFPIPQFTKKYKPTHVGYGPYPDQIRPWENGIIHRVQK